MSRVILTFRKGLLRATTAGAGALAGLMAWPQAALAQAAEGGYSQAGLVLAVVFSIAFGAAACGLAMILSRRRGDSLRGAVFTAVPTPRQVIGPQGQIVYANPAFYEFFGEAEESVAALLRRGAGDDAQAIDLVERLEANARNGIGGQIELRLPTPEAGGLSESEDGQDWYYVSAFPISGKPGYIYWGVDEISSGRQMEEVIQEQQSRFVELLEQAPIGFYSVDENGVFTFINRTLMEWLNIPHEKLESGEVRLHDVIADPLPEGTEPHDPFGDPEAFHGEVLLRSAKGRKFKASINQDLVYGEGGASLRTRSVVRDLTRERAMAQALERSEERFGRFFQEAPIGIVLLDAQGQISECNDSFVDLIKGKEKTFRNKMLTDFVFPEDKEKIGAILKKSLARADRDSALAPIEVRLGTESETICSMFIARMDDFDGQPSGFIGYFIDATEQKNLEVQFAQSQKMQAVGQLAGGIAHDFNNLLTAMIGFSDLLLLRHRPGDQSFADIMQIKQNANRAANLVRQLLAFSRQQTLQPRKLNVTDILAELSHLLRRLIGEHIELRMTHGRDIWTVRADQGQLEQVIINLAVNARDAMSHGDNLSIRTENVTVGKEKKFKAEVMPPGEYVLVEVADTGCGIPEENLDRIFDPFFSTKEVGAGTGLGLSTVYGIIKQSGGYVFVESVPDQGSTFSVYLPHFAGTSGSEEAQEAEGPTTRDLTGMGTLLLVEDEEAVRAFGSRALRNKGYNVMEADSGEAALEILQNGEGSIDLLITDVVMPRLDGPGLVQEVRKTQPDLKVIFISGYTEDSFRKRLGEDEGIHFLPKPFSLKQLAGKVKEVLGA